MNGRTHFDELVRACKRGKPAPPKTAAWFIEAVKEWDCGRVGTLDEALGLRRKAEAVNMRDKLIAEAADLAPKCWGKSQVARWLTTLLTHDNVILYDELCLAERLVARRRENVARELIRAADNAWTVPSQERLRRLL